jgi:hypothetical protein
MSGIVERKGAGPLFGLVNLVAAFALVSVLWYVFLHPNGVMALYTPMYGFSLIVAFVAAIILISKVIDCYPLHDTPAGDAVRGTVLTIEALVVMWVLVYGFFWGFIGRLGITYFSPYSIVRAGGTGAEIFNARENASTAIVYVLTAFLWVAMSWTAGFGKWPWKGASTGGRALAKLSTVGLLSIIVYVVLFHPHVSYLFYPAQTMAGVEPWWSGFAQTSSAYFNLGLLLCVVLWIVISDLLWEGYPWKLLDAGGQGSFGRGIFALVGTIALGVISFWIMLKVMDHFWFEPFEGGQYTDAPYFRYLHAGEISGFVILAAFIVKTYFNNIIDAGPLVVRALVRTVLAGVGGGLFYLFYYSPASTMLLGKVPGIAQPEDTPLVWTLLFLSVVMIQAEFFRGWPLTRRAGS